MCEDCHNAIHHDGKELRLKGKRKSAIRYATQMSVIRCMLLEKYPDAEETFGFVTKANRENLGIGKDHYLGACVIASCGKPIKLSDVVYYKRRVSKGDYQLCNGSRGEQKIPVGKILGFKKFDKVKYLGKEYFIKGRMTKCGYAFLMNVHGEQIDFSYMPRGNKTPKLLNCKRINARRSILCIQSIK